jgi:uncharacterized protein (TIGR02145 family)
MFNKLNLVVSSVLAALFVILFISCSKKATNPDALNTVTDVDGNVYTTVTIGTQVWMAENLKVTHYRNGDSIPNVSSDSIWIGLITGAYCNYNNDINNVATYGRLYNWYTVINSSNIAPVGWHVPSDSEWQVLVDYLGGDSIAGGKLKETGTVHWNSPNAGATNESGFSSLPEGIRNQGNYGSMGDYAFLWSSTRNSSNLAWYRGLDYGYSGIGRSYSNVQNGFSVRCVRD